MRQAESLAELKDELAATTAANRITRLIASIDSVSSGSAGCKKFSFEPVLRRAGLPPVELLVRGPSRHASVCREDAERPWPTL